MCGILGIVGTADVAALSPGARELLAQWKQAGWLHDD